MMFWVIAALLCLGALALMVPALLRGRNATGAEEADLAVYRAQLVELERDLDSGLIDAEEGKAARLEIERRLLRADERLRAAQGAAPLAKGRALRFAALVLAGLLPLGAFALYMAIGTPQALRPLPTPGHLASSVGGEVPRPQPDPELNALADQLRARLADTPEDGVGWALLARTYMTLGRYDEAAEAFRTALPLTAEKAEEKAEVLAGLGEALTLGAGGRVTQEAGRMFAEAAEADPSLAPARFYLAMAEYQKGNRQEALDRWTAMAEEAPPDAPWLPGLRMQIAQVSREIQRESVAALPEDERQAMIESMVEGLAARLEAEPDDVEGWRMLARSYTVLGRTEEAEKALAKAEALEAATPQNGQSKNNP